MNWVQTTDGKRIYITGILTNTDSTGWKDLEFDCRFYDKEMKLLDANTGRGGLTVGPNDEAAFRVSIAPTALTNDYAAYKISVSAARNDKSWF